MSTASVATARTPRFAWLQNGGRLLVSEMRCRWYLFAALGLIWMLAAIRLFVHYTPFVPILFNWTPSLPYTMVYANYGATQLNRGDLIVFSFHGEAGEGDYRGLKRQPLFKRVAGVSGDVITVQGRDVFINGEFAGRAKTHTFDKKRLEPIAPTVILPGYLYVQGTSPDSFDSRYASSGLVAVKDVTARVHPMF